MRVVLKAGFGAHFKDILPRYWGEPLRFAAAGMLLLTACSRASVEWSDISFSGPRPPRGLPIGRFNPSPQACPVSVRGVQSGSQVIAAWWELRTDSSAMLAVAHSSDAGKTWSTPSVADSSDRNPRGCSRPAPAIAVDSTNHYIHLAYFAEPRGGAGVFFAHSMDGGKTFHAPVPVVFGNNPSFVAVAANGDRVAVAYEDPNSSAPAIGIALSQTLGHIFGPGETISGDGEIPKQPTVDIQAHTIRVWWNDHAADPRISATRTAYREGRLMEHRAD